VQLSSARAGRLRDNVSHSEQTHLPRPHEPAALTCKRQSSFCCRCPIGRSLEQSKPATASHRQLLAPIQSHESVSEMQTKYFSLSLKSSGVLGGRVSCPHMCWWLRARALVTVLVASPEAG
jgi:hypothetical protein